MVEVKHTSGPWQVCHTTIGGKTYGAPWIEPVGADVDIQITGSGGARSYTKRIVEFRGTDDDEANARLIAAAPDLLDALKILLEVHDALGAGQSHAAQVARDALSKAGA